MSWSVIRCCVSTAMSMDTDTITCTLSWATALHCFIIALGRTSLFTHKLTSHMTAKIKNQLTSFSSDLVTTGLALSCFCTIQNVLLEIRFADQAVKTRLECRTICFRLLNTLCQVVGNLEPSKSLCFPRSSSYQGCRCPTGWTSTRS
ncbi:hypothetical protein F4779DRAFT_592560 [Xylariaceae sp. FL0662B]|nr:hypothetical protein F4779DRAFT_592560 [Xylariaceae sp. FL0662B]